MSLQVILGIYWRAYSLNKKIVSLIFIALMCFAALIVPIVPVHGQSSSVNILQVTPSSDSGPVGQDVIVQGTISAPNDTYVVFFVHISLPKVPLRDIMLA